VDVGISKAGAGEEKAGRNAKRGGGETGSHFKFSAAMRHLRHEEGGMAKGPKQNDIYIFNNKKIDKYFTRI
jgi:hypothetical protein